MLLKPLDRALADGDTIHAVIAGSGVNSVGHTPGGISVPGAAALASLLRARTRARASIRSRWRISKRTAPARRSAIRSRRVR